jgi:ABC-type transport system involved in multi-copper enzyme maturation permease subunit
MRNILIMTSFTLREALARKVFLFFLGISVLVIIGMAIIFTIVDTTALIEGINPTGNKIILSEIITVLELAIAGQLANLCLLLAIFSSSSFVPVMLEKGNIDLLLSKPISRNQMLLGKYFGGLLVVLLNIAFLIIGVWLVISFKFSYWDFSFLSVIPVVTFTFAVLYSIIVLFGVITQGSVLGMIVTYFIFLILSPILLLGKERLHILIESEFIKSIVEGLYYVFPKTFELMGKIMIDLTSGKGITDYQPVLTSLLFLILILMYSLFLFSKKDF